MSAEPRVGDQNPESYVSVVGRRVEWVIPAYNEAASIKDLISRIDFVSSGESWDYSILVVDDGSVDGTGGLALEQAQLGLPVEVLRNEPNQGLGRTIGRGLRHASERLDGDAVIMTLDADLTQDPAYAPAMIQKVAEGYDVVIASRYRPGAKVEGLSMLRRALSYSASGLVSLIRPIRGVRDYSCGFRAYRASVVSQAFAEVGDDFVSERGFASMLEIAERLRESASFTEVPFVLRYQDKRKASEIRIMPTIGAYFRVLVKVASTQRKVVPVATLGVAVSAIIVGSLAQLLLRLGMVGSADLTVAQTLLFAATSPLVLGGLALYVLSSVLWLGILSRIELSVAYPLGASGYALVVLLAAMSGETVSAARWLGVLSITVGVLLVAWLGVAPVKKVARP